jgi:hypothetical protein
MVLAKVVDPVELEAMVVEMVEMVEPAAHLLALDQLVVRGLQELQLNKSQPQEVLL